ncbi:MAG: aminotransferase class V-fold PLP-dependent enzyme [Candidatus Thorarchaeota archaeon]|nr:aminotransferase class V-fold PLP-dependent enzyme [Candidatus Thorarchaeota archaeon]
MSGLDVKKDFNIFRTHPNLIYLDTASTGLIPQTVVQDVSSFLDNIVVSSRRGAHSLAVKGAELVEAARTHLAQIFDSVPSQISFHGTTADAVSSIIFGYDWKGNNRNTIVVSATEEHDTLLPAMHAAKILGLNVQVIPTDDFGLLDLDKMLESLNSNVGIVIANTNPVGIGSKNPVLEVSQKAHESGVLVLSDATRGIGTSAVVPKDIGADIVFFSANVAFLAPPGLTVQWIDSSLGSSFAPGIVGNNSASNVTMTSYELALPPDKFESGTLNVPAIVGLNSALTYLESIGLEKVHHHIEALSSKLWAGFTHMDGIITYGTFQPGQSVVGFNVGTEDPLNCHDVALFLDQSDIAVRSGLLCAHPLIQSLSPDGIVQVSLHVYNTLDDINRLLEILESIVGML